MLQRADTTSPPMLNPTIGGNRCSHSAMRCSHLAATRPPPFLATADTSICALTSTSHAFPKCPRSHSSTSRQSLSFAPRTRASLSSRSASAHSPRPLASCFCSDSSAAHRVSTFRASTHSLCKIAFRISSKCRSYTAELASILRCGKKILMRSSAGCTASCSLTVSPLCITDLPSLPQGWYQTGCRPLVFKLNYPRTLIHIQAAPHAGARCVQR